MLLKALASTAICLATLSSVTSVGGAPADTNSSSVSSGTCTLSSPASIPSDSGSNTTSNSTSSGTGTLSSPASIPSGSGSNSTSNSTSTNTTSSSSGPQFVIYSDKSVEGVVPDVSDVEGYTVFALSFLTGSSAVDQAEAWANLDNSTRNDIKNKYNSAGIKLIVSAFGSTISPTTSGVDATQVANNMATWVKTYGLDGIDVDYEDTTAMNAQDGKAEAWLTTFTQTLRSQLPQGQYILTHAPMAPWFSTTKYKSGAYMTVNKNVGDMIDWYNVQFYNQIGDYSTCDSLLNKAIENPNTSLFEIAAAGVDVNKLVIGKPAITSDASNGFIDTNTLATCIAQAKQKNWNAGAMVWEYPDANSAWIKTVRGSAFPIS